MTIDSLSKYEFTSELDGGAIWWWGKTEFEMTIRDIFESELRNEKKEPLQMCQISPIYPSHPCPITHRLGKVFSFGVEIPSLKLSPKL